MRAISLVNCISCYSYNIQNKSIFNIALHILVYDSKTPSKFKTPSMDLKCKLYKKITSVAPHFDKSKAGSGESFAYQTKVNLTWLYIKYFTEYNLTQNVNYNWRIYWVHLGSVE